MGHAKKLAQKNLRPWTLAAAAASRPLAALSLAVLSLAVVGGGCAAGNVVSEDDSSSGASSPSTGGMGGAGGVASNGSGGTGGESLCDVDCSTISTPDCSVAVCNDGSHQGTVGSCVVIDADDGTACDDGQFCTVDDTCQAGVCNGGGQNTCGQTPGPCEQVTCDEASSSCTMTPSQNGDPCTPTDLCMVNATCTNGQCLGEVKDCFFAPIDNECHAAVCNPMNGQCESEPDSTKNGNACVDQTDLCIVNHTCDNGNCTGGVTKDCSGLTAGCNIGVCDTTTGQCVQQAVMNGGLCDDLDACTSGETCNNGTCSGGAVETQCINGDNCCPSNCDDTNDDDCANCDWSTAPFPVSFNAGNSVGDMTFDDQCNLYWSTDGGTVFRMNRNTSTPTVLHTFSSNARGIVYHPGLDLLFVGVVDQVYSLPKTGGSPTAIGTSQGSYLNGMEVAPAGWGAYGNQLIIARGQSDSIIAVNPTTGTSSTVASTTIDVSDIVFDADTGTLYAALYQSGGVYTVSPTGQLTSFASPACSPDGLAILASQYLYIACGSNDTLHRATIPGGTLQQITAPGLALNGGWAPAGLIFDGLDNLIVMEDGEQLSVFTP